MISTCSRRLATLVLLGVLSPFLPAQSVGHSLLRVPEQTAAEKAVRQTRVKATLDRVGPAVVHVLVRVRGMFRVQRESSGVLITAGGLVLTNWHLIADGLNREGTPRAGYRILVRTADGQERAAALVDSDPKSDLALLQLALAEGVSVPFVRGGDSRAILPGETVLVSARPDEKIHANFIGAASDAQCGVRLNKVPVAKDDLLLTDANIKRFADGAPIFDINGHLLAIVNTARARPPLGKKPTEEEKREHQNSFGFATRVHVARRVFPKAFAKLTRAKTSPAQAKVRRAGIVSVIAKAKVAVVSVRRSTVKAMPVPDPSDPNGKFEDDTIASGVIVHPNGLVLTNAHVVGDGDVLVTLFDGKTYEGKVVGKEPTKNIALVKLTLPDGKSLPFLELADSGASILGERIAVLGNRYGHTLSVKVGVLSSKERAKDVDDQHKKSMGHCQTDANIHNGNTGGALIDLRGRLLGINDAKAAIDKDDEKASHEAEAKTTNTTIGFAVPVNWIRTQLREELAKYAGAEGHLTQPPEVTEVDRRVRESQITRQVAAHADCFLNVFVKKEKLETAKRSVADELFPQPPDESDYHLLGQGSGVIIDPTGLALTNWHVVKNAVYTDAAARKGVIVFVSLANDKRYPVKVLSTSSNDDLALLQLELAPGEKVQAIRLGDSDAIEVGETVIAVGNPHGFANSVTAGLIAAKNRDVLINGRARFFRGMIQTDAPINPGNSGGALIDLNGYLIGINTAGDHREARIGFSIPVNHVRKQFHSTLLSSDRLRSVFLGMKPTDRESGGVFADTVGVFGPARDAGVQEGDRIMRAQGQVIIDSVQFRKIAMDAPPFQRFTLEVERDKKRLKLVLEPLSDASWAIFRRAMFAVKEVSFADAGKQLTQASIAAYREHTGDSKGRPAQMMESGLMVTHVHPDAAEDMDMQRGDVIVGLHLKVREIHLKDRFVLERISDLSQLLNHIRGQATKEGKTIELWIARRGEVIKAKVFVKKIKRSS